MDLGNGDVFESMDIGRGIIPVNLGAITSGNNDGAWADITPFQGGIAVIFFAGTGTAGQDPTFTLRQATSNTGDNAKALSFERIYTKQAAALSTGVDWTVVTRTGSNANSTYTNGTSAEQQQIWAVHVHHHMMDSQSGFRFVSLRIPDTGSAAQVGTGLYLGLGPRYSGDQMGHL